MKVNAALIVVLTAFAFLATSAHATTIRTGSNYGVLGGITSASQSYAIGDETVVCESTTEPSATNPCTVWSLLLQINNAPTDPDLDEAIELTLPDNDGVLGILNCNVFDSSTDTYDSGSQSFGSLCTPNTNPTNSNCDLTGITPTSGGTIMLPATCIVAGETFFFDETTDSLAAPSAVGSVTTPEPSSLVMLAFGLIPLAALFRRRRAGMAPTYPEAQPLR